ncbi:hypothetical protein ACH5RR_019481 [Cinchona calisaya]|uniref:Uncharacterized protein n=1 Tax=Cinchona calisaya TaxID=153742 RepID=A0ABD2ZSB2_9GENT
MVEEEKGVLEGWNVEDMKKLLEIPTEFTRNYQKNELENRPKRRRIHPDCCYLIFDSQLVGLIFMNSRSIAASTVSCNAGNKKNFFFFVLICLFPRFLGITVVFENFLLFKAIVRCPSSSVPVLPSSREILL